MGDGHLEQMVSEADVLLPPVRAVVRVPDPVVEEPKARGPLEGWELGQRKMLVVFRAVLG
jgi:hypothetical protein